MIPPMMIAGLLAQMLGTGMQMRANNKVQSQQNAAMQAERLRQQQFDQQRQAAIDRTLPKFSAEQQTQDRGDLASRLEAFLQPTERAATSGEYLPENPGAPKEIQDSLAAQLAKSLASGRQYATNLSRMSAFGGRGQQNNFTLGRLGQTTGMLGNDSARSSGLLDYELQAANRAGNSSRVGADILNGVGSLASLYSITTPRAVPKPQIF